MERAGASPFAPSVRVPGTEQGDDQDAREDGPQRVVEEVGAEVQALDLLAQPPRRPSRGSAIICPKSNVLVFVATHAERRGGDGSVDFAGEA